MAPVIDKTVWTSEELAVQQVPNHTIAVEITVDAINRQIAQRIVTKKMDGITADSNLLLGWSFATHERPDLPALLGQHLEQSGRYR